MQRSDVKGQKKQEEQEVNCCKSNDNAVAAEEKHIVFTAPKINGLESHARKIKMHSSLNAVICFKNVRNRIMCFCSMKDLMALEPVCTLTNNSTEIRKIVATIRQGCETTDHVVEVRGALTHLCYKTECLDHDADKHRRNLFIKSGACEVLAQLLRLPRYRHNAGLRQEACWAVHHLTREKDGKRRMYEENVHKIIVSMLGDKDLLQYIDLQAKALSAVINLALGEREVGLLLKEGVCEKIVSLLTNPEFAAEKDLQFYCLRCIHNLAYYPTIKWPLFRAGAVEAVAHTLHNPVITNCHRTLSVSLSSLRNLRTVESVKEMVNLGVHKMVLAVCLEKKNKDALKVHEHGLLVLLACIRAGNRRSFGDICKDLEQGGVCKLFINELTTPPAMNEFNIQEAVFALVSHVMCEVDIYTKLITMDIVRHLKAAMRRLNHKQLTVWGKDIVKAFEGLTHPHLTR